MISLFSWEDELLYNIYLQANASFKILCSNLIFAAPLNKRAHYALRLALSLSAYLLIYAISVALRYYHSSTFTRVLVHMLRISMLFFISYVCYDDNFHNRIRAICCGFAAREIGSAIYSFLLMMLRIERETISLLHLTDGSSMGPLDWVIYYAVHIAVYYLTYRIMPIRRYDELDKISLRRTVILSLTCFLVLVVPDVVRNEIGQSGIAEIFVYRFYLFSCGVFILFMLNSVDFQSKYRQEKAIMERMLTEEQKQYQQLKESMDIINMRCHDLKHQLDNFSDHLTCQEIESLHEAMDFYDSNIKTGCEVLDVVLHSSLMRCKKNEIQLTCLADGTALNFMDVSHLYSLLNNALSNAIEAAAKLTEPGKRTISLKVACQNNVVTIEVTNYFNNSLPLPGGTSKEDQNRHGFGTMSMRYIVDQYGGNLTVHTERDIYCLCISIPIS